MFLYQKLSTLKEINGLPPLPQYIKDGLSDRFELRDYQIEAFQNFIAYYTSEGLRKNKQLHLLFHMATGSGKTMMMAGLMLYLYKQGYRNFLFFVNMTNIIEKTKDNFLNKSSPKYLFSENIVINGERIAIREVNSFQDVSDDAINICFTTTQQLHYDLNVPKENSLTIADFEDKKVVLISDESHHVNTDTKKGKASKLEENSWEYSVNRVFHSNKDNALIEFTATCDLKDPNVLAKYKDKIIYDYPLSKFRESKYTKDFQNLQTDFDYWERTLQALILSQYRLKLFAEHSHNIKPVILLKSQRINDSKDFYEEFLDRLSKLTGDDIASINIGINPIISKAFEYFNRKGITFQMLAEELKHAFAEEHCIIMNGSTDNTAEKQIAVNTLEDSSNPYRLIFTVDMLNEGWDVLNLFDIVRLYETRQGGKKISPYTIKEAQLIGRGARYCPFKVMEGQDKYKRKYDDDLTNEMRICETLYYHSKQNSRYITELRQALTELGLLPDKKVEVEYIIKDNFKQDEVYKKGFIFSNEKVIKSRHMVTKLDDKVRNLVFDINNVVGSTTIYDLFGTSEVENEGQVYKHTIKIKEVDIPICNAAIHNFDGLKFNVLKSHFPNLKSTREFITSEDYLGNITMLIKTNNEELKGIDLYKGCMEVFTRISEIVSNIEAEYEGTKEFKAKRLHEVIKNKVRYIENPTGDGEGVSQNEVSAPLRLDLSKEDWYIFNDNFGTSEEKKFVVYFSHIVAELKKKYEKVYLIRNERFPELSIYTFDTGERFEPDYVLLLQKNNTDGYEQQQIFIEPKGEHLIDKDTWKQNLLLRLEQEAIPQIKYVDDNEYKIIGLPFFNADSNNDEFITAIEKLYK